MYGPHGPSIDCSREVPTDIGVLLGAPIWISRTSRILGQGFHANIHLVGSQLLRLSRTTPTNIYKGMAAMPSSPRREPILVFRCWRSRMGGCQEFMDYQKYMHSQSQFQDRVPLTMQCGSDRLSWPKVCATLQPHHSQAKLEISTRFVDFSKYLTFQGKSSPSYSEYLDFQKYTHRCPLPGATAVLEMFETDGLCTSNIQCLKL